MAIYEENYFDMWQIFVNEIIGNVWLFLIVGLIILTYFGIKAKMPIEVVSLFGIFWLILVFSKATSLIVIWVMIILFVGFNIYYVVAKALRGG